MNPPKDVDPKAGRPWSPLAKGFASAALLFHCASVLAGAFGVPPFSESERMVKELFTPYHELIDQGYSYRYFAPEPPPTPILVAKLLDKDGKVLEEVRVPERGVRPRMRYQRQLAIATAMAMEGELARSAPDGRPPFWAASFAKALGRRNPSCTGVQLFQRIHLIPNLEETRAILRRGETPPDADSPEFYTAPEKIGDYACDPEAP